MKKVIDKKEFQSLLFDGMSIMVGGFMVVGTPLTLIDYIAESNVKDITIICNDAGLLSKGVGKLIDNNQVSKLIASHIGLNPEAGNRMSAGSMDVTLVPQGTLAERIRAKGAGLGGFYTPTGIGTMVEEGKELKVIDGKNYLLELPLGADLAIILGDKVDEKGNIKYAKTTRNFNPIMATACKKVVVEAREITTDFLNPDSVDTPHIFTNYIVKGEQ